MIARWLGVAVVCVWAAVVRAQMPVTARFEASPGSPLIGEPVTLILVVEAPSDAVVTLPQFAAGWPPFEVRAVGEAEQATGDGRTVYRQPLTVVLWQPGDYRTPETVVEYRPPGSGESLRVIVEPAFFTVPSVIEPDDLVLRPLKPLEIPLYISPWVIVAGGGLAAAGGLSAARQLRKRARKPVREHLPDATARTLAELRRVRGLALPAAEAYVLVGNCLRRYLEERFEAAAPEQTTDELLAVLQRRPELSARQHRELRRMLEQIDLVKFARVRPTQESTQRLFQVVSRWVVGVSSQEEQP